MTRSDDDAELRHLERAFAAAVGARPGERVLDVGCGDGGPTRMAARAVRGGRALGVDISSERITAARRKAWVEGPGNASFEVADAQTHAFDEAGFDVVMSRFGTMFFAEPHAAFANLARATAAGGRLVMSVWRDADRNAWARPLLSRILDAPAPADRSGPFSLADPDATRALLERAGWTRVAFEEVRWPLWYGPDVDTALTTLTRLDDPREALSRFDGDDRRRAERRLRDELAAHLTADGVLFDARAWIVTARRRPREAA
ncbi:class I SAM-dependent methyltransferase [Microbacterium marinilacus]|uniref:Class I SAM-dependent methyltransferase n=1 Tax=Microbacterium marinilacus TaxID=415209 RepID=A0ABP7BF94_9MICO|nr:class I SAM-dependent methyltransferase [Microbacterium marinilacus]MBY0689016.1 class I SAM-dependent methyltransferase [Microbacterium marinilacus]